MATGGNVTVIAVGLDGNSANGGGGGKINAL